MDIIIKLNHINHYKIFLQHSATYSTRASVVLNNLLDMSHKSPTSTNGRDPFSECKVKPVQLHPEIFFVIFVFVVERSQLWRIFTVWHVLLDYLRR